MNSVFRASFRLFLSHFLKIDNGVYKSGRNRSRKGEFESQGNLHGDYKNPSQEAIGLTQLCTCLTLIVVHFFAVTACLWRETFQCNVFMENVNTEHQLFLSLSLLRWFELAGIIGIKFNALCTAVVAVVVA